SRRTSVLLPLPVGATRITLGEMPSGLIVSLAISLFSGPAIPMISGAFAAALTMSSGARSSNETGAAGSSPDPVDGLAGLTRADAPVGPWRPGRRDRSGVHGPVRPQWPEHRSMAEGASGRVMALRAAVHRRLTRLA